MLRVKSLLLLVLITCLQLVQLSCSKFGGTPPPPPPDPCTGVIMGLSGVVSNPSVAGGGDGKITVSVSSGTGYMFSLNNGTYQALGKFYNLAAGNYTVTAINGDGCTGSISFVLTDPAISCTGVNITVNASATVNDPCTTNNGTVSVLASGGTPPYTYNLNGGVYQSSAIFNALATGSYAVTAKDANGCTGSASVVVSNAAAGPLFTQVRTLIRNNCLYCHGPAVSNGINLSVDWNIVAGKDRIKARAVDGIPSPMPQTGLLSASDRQKITDWINAGGNYSN
jgi:mono/diheme cytochrome c family protein